MAFTLAPTVDEPVDCKNTTADTTEVLNKECDYCLSITLIIVLIVGSWALWPSPPPRHSWPRFSLNLTSTEGLVPSSQSLTTISPVFNLTLHVDGRNATGNNYCVENGETTVFYKGVKIAATPMAFFCFEGLREQDITILAWNMDLPLPPFLRKQLLDDVSGNKAVLDVQLSVVVALDGYISQGRVFIDCTMVDADAAWSPCKFNGY